MSICKQKKRKSVLPEHLKYAKKHSAVKNIIKSVVCQFFIVKSRFFYLMSKTENTPNPIPYSCTALNLSLKYNFDTVTLQSIENTDIIGNKTLALTFDESTKVK